jgi:CRISPR-associated protein Cas2
MLYIISYDIPSDRRRTRLAKLLEGYGSRVQYSVFECDLTTAQFQRLRGRIGKLVDPQADRVRIYRLCAACVGTVECIGGGTVEQTVDCIIV